MTTLDRKIIGQSPSTLRLKKMIKLVASSDAPVIITGPTGSGKELVAEALHDESRRKGKFIAINCSAIPKELIEAEIFGFEKGAFTGAIKTTQGKFEQAQKGTIFLDEIGDMPSDLQTKLLRTLENAVITRVGSNSEIKLNVRVVCATHKDLNRLVSQNEFREDLLFRLNVFPIEVPSLKDRKEDIPDLLDFFLKKKFFQNDISQKPYFDESGLAKLKNYGWPGNIRELRNIIERACIFFPKSKITADDVENYLLTVNDDVVLRKKEQDTIWEEIDNLGNLSAKEEDKEPVKVPSPNDFSTWFETNNSVDMRVLLRDIEIVLIEAAMDRNNGNTSEAAKDLKLLRTTLIEKVKKYGI